MPPQSSNQPAAAAAAGETRYEVIGGVTGMAPGETFTASELAAKHPGHGGVDRLLSHGTVRVFDPANPYAPDAGVEVSGNTGNPSLRTLRAARANANAPQPNAPLPAPGGPPGQVRRSVSVQPSGPAEPERP